MRNVKRLIDMATVKYRKAFAKQTAAAVGYLACVGVLGAAMGPFEPGARLGVLVALIVAAGVPVYLKIRSMASAECPHCGEDLFRLLEGAGGSATRVAYCPYCGYRIET